MSELPGSLRALIAARIDQLAAPQRAIIDNAAVLGTSDSIGSLARFAEAMGQDFHLADLDELAADGLLEIDGRWWRFRSAVVREVAYQTLTKRVRAQRHAGVAAVMAERGAPIDDVAHHAATAAELLAELGPVDGVRPTITGHAVAALLEAATAAVETGRYETAIRHASRALDLHQADPSTERSLLLVRSEAELERRNVAEATADAEEVLAGAIADGDRTQEAEARRRLGSVAQVQGDLPTARRELGDGRSSCSARSTTPGGWPTPCGPGASPRCSAARWRTPARSSARRWRSTTRSTTSAGHAWTHQNLAWVAFQAGDFDDAEVQLIEAKERFEELGDANGVSWADGLRAYVLYFQRRFDEAEQLAVAVEVEARRRADSWAGLMMQTLLANLRLWTGRLADAEQFAERALNGFRDINDRYGVMQALGPLNRARAGLGKKADAKRGVEEAISLGKAFGELGMALQGAAGVAMHLGGGEQALHLAEQVIERNQATGTSQHEALVLLALANLQVGDVDQAVAAIEQVDIDDFPFGLAARALVRAVAGDTADGAGRRRGRRGDARGELLRPGDRAPRRRAGLRAGRRCGGRRASGWSA